VVKKGFTKIFNTKSMKKRTAVALFVPVIHAGYLTFFKEHKGDAFVFGKSLVKDYPRLERDIRAVDPKQVAEALTRILKRKVAVLEKQDILAFTKKYPKVIISNEEISEMVAQKFFGGIEVEYKPAFLRWDRKISDTEHEVAPDRKITTAEAHRALAAQARLEGTKSPDWWRQIGALLFRDGEVLVSGHNKHLPHVRHQDAFGDPRMNYDYGEAPSVYLSIHAETHALVQAAKQGIKTEGADMFVSIFPCANCARIISQSGVRRVYYSGGYSMLEGEKILKDAGIEIILVQ